MALSSTSYSLASVSVSYKTLDAGLFLQEGKDINYASSDRAAKLVAQMPRKDRKALMEPIERGLIDPQSVFYLIDDKSEGQVAICVEDFINLASTSSSDPSSEQQQDEYGHSSVQVYTPTPQRLIEALRRISVSDNISMSAYTSIDSESGYLSPSEPSRSRTTTDESTASVGTMNSETPVIPESRPPLRPSSPLAASLNTQKYSESNDAGAFGQRIKRPSFYLPEDGYMKEISPSEIISSDAVSKYTDIEKKVPKLDEFNASDENTARNKDERWRKINTILKRRFLLPFIIAVVVIIAAALGLGIYFYLKDPLLEKPPTTTPAAPSRTSNETFNCVNGSTYKITLDSAQLPLAELNIPEKYPTLIMGSLEYLFVSNVTRWVDAQAYCTAWCGYLTSIKGPEENQKILEMVKGHMPTFSHYWIGWKKWNNMWYLDDESNSSYSNFAPGEYNLQSNDNNRWGCVEVDGRGLWSWSMQDCNAVLPFVCERNSSDPMIQKTPFAPHQEVKCQDAGGMCKMDNDCADGTQQRHLCPEQPIDIVCCMPNKRKPPPVFNSTVTTCTDAGGVCNHVVYDECRGNFVAFNLSQSCPSTPRTYDCCIKNVTFP